MLDASWTQTRHRDAARTLATTTHSDLLELCCTASADTIAARLSRRTPGTSDADQLIATALSTDTDPWPQATMIVTDRHPDTSGGQTLAALGSDQRVQPTAIG